MTERAASTVFDRVAHEYDRTRGGLERGAQAAAALAELLPAGEPLLEVGVGTGLVATALIDRGRRVVGVDMSLPMLAQARTRLPGLVVAGDAARLPVASGSVAAVVFVHVLHLVGDLTATLTEAARVLRPGGRVVASAGPEDPPPSDDISAIMMELARRTGRPDERPDRLGTVLDAAGRCGLTVVGRSGYRPSHLGITPAEAVDRIRTRTWSWTWTIDDQVWAAEVGPAIDALRRLPDQDRPRRDSTEMPLIALGRVADAGAPAAG